MFRDGAVSHIHYQGKTFAMFKKICFLSILSFFTLSSMQNLSSEIGPGDPIKNMPTLLSNEPTAAVSTWIDSLYTHLSLEAKGLDKTAWYAACKGYQYMLYKKQLRKSNLLTICDYSKSSTEKRFYVIDMVQEKVLHFTWVAHGRNSGTEYATAFSNKADSYKSSLGCMLTAETYIGGNGYSLRLDGKEIGINNNVRNRDIVIHGSQYVSMDRARAGMMMGRSFGCPALPDVSAKKIIDCIKGGSCFFAWYPQTSYAKNSRIMNAEFIWPISKTFIQPGLADSCTTHQDTVAICNQESDADLK